MKKYYMVVASCILISATALCMDDVKKEENEEDDDYEIVTAEENLKQDSVIISSTQPINTLAVVTALQQLSEAPVSPSLHVRIIERPSSPTLSKQMFTPSSSASPASSLTLSDSSSGMQAKLAATQQKLIILATPPLVTQRTQSISEASQLSPSTESSLSSQARNIVDSPVSIKITIDSIDSKENKIKKNIPPLSITSKQVLHTRKKITPPVPSSRNGCWDCFQLCCPTARLTRLKGK